MKDEKWLAEQALTKGLVNWQVGLHHKHGGASHLGLLEDVASLSVQDTIDATNHLFWTLSGNTRLSVAIGQGRARDKRAGQAFLPGSPQGRWAP